MYLFISSNSPFLISNMNPGIILEWIYLSLNVDQVHLNTIFHPQDYLLQNGANVHSQDGGGLVSLHNARSSGYAEVINLSWAECKTDSKPRDN